MEWGISWADGIICADKDIKRKQMQGVLKEWQIILFWREYVSTRNNADRQISSSESMAWHTVTAQLVTE